MELDNKSLNNFLFIDHLSSRVTYSARSAITKVESFVTIHNLNKPHTHCQMFHVLTLHSRFHIVQHIVLVRWPYTSPLSMRARGRWGRLSESRYRADRSLAGHVRQQHLLKPCVTATLQRKLVLSELQGLLQSELEFLLEAL